MTDPPDSTDAPLTRERVLLRVADLLRDVCGRSAHKVRECVTLAALNFDHMQLHHARAFILRAMSERVEQRAVLGPIDAPDALLERLGLALALLHLREVRAPAECPEQAQALAAACKAGLPPDAVLRRGGQTAGGRSLWIEVNYTTQRGSTDVKAIAAFVWNGRAWICTEKLPRRASPVRGASVPQPW